MNLIDSINTRLQISGKYTDLVCLPFNRCPLYPKDALLLLASTLALVKECRWGEREKKRGREGEKKETKKKQEKQREK